MGYFEVFKKDANDISNFSAANNPRLSNLRIKIKDDTRHCVGLQPNHSISKEFVVPEKGHLVFGLAARMPKGLEKQYYLEVLARQESGSLVSLYKTGFDAKREWKDHDINLHRFAGRKVKMIFQFVYEGDTKKQEFAKALAFVSNPRVIRDEPDKPNIILIVLDALRADHVSYDPAEPGVTPRLAGLASKGVGFKRHYSQSSWTGPSVPSLLTSRMPAQNRNFSFASMKLPAEQKTMTDILSASGRRTAAVSTQLIVSHRFNYDRGFDCFKFAFNLPYSGGRSGEAITDKATSWLESYHELPFFLYLHYMDPHEPYMPPWGFIEPDKDKVSRLKYIATIPWWGKYNVKNIFPLYPLRFKETYKSLYRTEVRYMDYSLGKLFDKLAELGLMKNTMIVITSDHGEAFFEHGTMMGHGTSLYEEQVKIPFIIYYPPEIEGGRVVKSVTSNLDLLPTVLDYAGLPPAEGLMGRSLRPVIEGEIKERERAVFAELPRLINYHYLHPDHRKGQKDSLVRAMITKKYKIIEYTDQEENASRVEVYNLEKDPAEKNPYPLHREEKFLSYKNQMDEFFQNLGAEIPPPGSEQPNRQEVEILKSLGYVR
ncbi:MAG: sulfatase [bacterium]